MAKILVIDDSEDIRVLLHQALQSAGHSVIEAADGDLGLKAFREHQPDLVITDIVMPNKEGLETIMELRREFPAVKIVAMSGGTRGMVISFLPAAKKLGADYTLPKPFNLGELLVIVDEALGLARR